ncbi:LOW QUALITY PROTEIN: hypothetical protein ACHAW6_001903 [Cyclotella cf. meneghiniana]
MVILGETADISPFCEFGFWDWVKLWDKGVAFLDNQMVLSKYLSPSIDVGPAMTQHIMKANGEYEDRSTLRQLMLMSIYTHELTRVLCQKHDSNGVPVGAAHKQPAMNTHVYEVRFPEGRTKDLAANTIAEALLSETLMRTIMSCLTPSWIIGRIPMWPSLGMIRSKSLMLCCEWMDGSTSWQKLSDLKESHPAEFALAAGIANELSFDWWVTWFLKKRDQIISLVKHRNARYHKWTHNFGSELPKTVDEAYVIDKATGTTFWRDVIKLEMKNVQVAFDVLPDGVAPPLDHQYMKCHMIFDVKMDFHCPIIARGHMTKAPATLTYASVVSQDTMWIALLVAALNNVDIWAADVLNTYIAAP